MDIDDVVELLYGDGSEKLQGLKQVMDACQDTSSMEYLVTNNQLMAVCSRLFGEGHSLEICFALGKLFLALATVEDFHDILSGYRVGALALGVVELELQRALHKGTIAVRSLDIAAPKVSYAFTKKQEALIMICCDILSYIADDFGALRKMIKRNIATTLGHCLNMKALPALLSALTLLSKVSVFQDAANELSSKESDAIYNLVELLLVSELNNLVASVLFNLSFHEECLCIISSTNIHSKILGLLGKESSPHSVYSLAYQISCSESSRDRLVKAAMFTPGIWHELLNRIQPQHEMHEGLAGLLVNVTLNPICAEELVQRGIAGAILGVLKESEDEFTMHVLLKVLRNLSQWSRDLQIKLQKAFSGGTSQLVGHVKNIESYFDSVRSKRESNAAQNIMYWEHRFWDPHVESILECALSCSSDDLLVEWFGILSNITKDDLSAGLTWNDIIIDNSSKILRLCHNALDSSRCDLKIRVIVWLGDLCTSQEGSAWIAGSNLVEAIHEAWQNTAHGVSDEEIKLQILLSYQQFIMYDDTRFQVVGGHGEYQITCELSLLAKLCEKRIISPILGVVESIIDCLNGSTILRAAAEE